jgi:hypothetical protein
MSKQDLTTDTDAGFTGDHAEGAGPGPDTALDALPAAAPDELAANADHTCAASEHWKAQAQAHAARAAQLDARIASLEADLAAARDAVDHAERRHQIDLALIEERAIDLESTRLLTELAVQQMPAKDVRAVVADLRRRKPFLFEPAPRARALPGPMSPAPRTSPELAAIEHAAEEAATTGDRNALLRYLRARRGD